MDEDICSNKYISEVDHGLSVAVLNCCSQVAAILLNRNSDNSNTLFNRPINF